MKPSDFGHLIRAKREAQGLSREKLAAVAGYSATTVQKAEMGKPVSAQTLADLAQAVGLDAKKG